MREVAFWVILLVAMLVFVMPNIHIVSEPWSEYIQEYCEEIGKSEDDC